MGGVADVLLNVIYEHSLPPNQWHSNSPQPTLLVHSHSSTTPYSRAVLSSGSHIAFAKLHAILHHHIYPCVFDM
jgi:hypothetical protein